MLNVSPAISTIVARPSLSSSRNSTIDIIRTIACFGVITIHVHSSTAEAESIGLFFLNFCVPFFFVTALTYFINNLNSALDLGATITKIFKRIGIPFLAWSLIYAALLFIKSNVSGKPYQFNFTRIFLYGESAEHMYYLPELLVMQLLVLGIYLVANRIKIHIGLLLIIGTVFYLAWGHWHQYFGVTPTKCVITYIIASFFISRIIKSSNKRWQLLLIGSILFLIPVILSNFSITTTPFLNEYFFSLPLSGIGLLLIALNFPNIEAPIWTKSITFATYGIYLSHVMFLEAFEFISEKLHISIKYTLTNKLLIAFVIFVICIIFIIVVRKIHKLRPILLGEG